jgi:hypothetical protein
MNHKLKDSSQTQYMTSIQSLSKCLPGIHHITSIYPIMMESDKLTKDQNPKENACFFICMK